MEVPQDVAGLKFTIFGEGQFSGFQVSHDPVTNLIWLASALFMLGMVLVFYVPHLEVRLMVRSVENAIQILASITPSRSLIAASEIRNISRELARMSGEGVDKE